MNTHPKKTRGTKPTEPVSPSTVAPEIKNVSPTASKIGHVIALHVIHETKIRGFEYTGYTATDYPIEDPCVTKPICGPVV